MNDDFFKINGKIYHKGKQVAKSNDILKNHRAFVIHKGERVIEKDKKKLLDLEKKYKIKLFPRIKI